jgi:hypothetical protein
MGRLNKSDRANNKLDSRLNKSDRANMQPGSKQKQKLKGWLNV